MANANADLYRQVEPDIGNPVFYESATEKLNYAIFLPAKNDSDGLSLIATAHRSKHWSGYRREKPHSRFALICLSSSHVTEVAMQIGFPDFDIKATPDAIDDEFGQPFAHCVAVRINIQDYKSSNKQLKEQCKTWARRLADHYSRSVIGPFSDPLTPESYRPQ